jgi:general secretion pathway protein G
VSGNKPKTRQSAFTLIELLIVMSIIATLLTIAVPRYFRSLEYSKESVLRQDLAVLRETIDKYYADVGKYPESLAVLVDQRYLHAVPVDPFAQSADKWVLVQSEDPDHPGIRDVKSGAEGNGTDGTPYNIW